MFQKETGQKLPNTGFGNNFLDLTPWAQGIKEKINKLDFMKIFKLCASKDTLNTVKRQSTKWKKIFVYHILDKVFISKIYREFLKLNKNKQPYLKMNQGFEQAFLLRST